MELHHFNELPLERQRAELKKCCGSEQWVNAMVTKFPYQSLVALQKASEEIWFGLSESDWKEAFEHHPKIGDVNMLREKFGTTANWAAGEQGAVRSASESTLQELKDLNEKYEVRFGYIFIVCATGRSADEMLTVLKSRLKNNPAFEITVAAQEQNKITHLRLEKLFS